MENTEFEALEFEIKGLLDELSNQSGDQEVIHLMEEWLYTRMGHVYKINPVYEYRRQT